VAGNLVHSGPGAVRSVAGLAEDRPSGPERAGEIEAPSRRRTARYDR
jgi:hypothetical protein